jgi:DNA-binding MarR family transcriptional regulator
VTAWTVVAQQPEGGEPPSLRRARGGAEAFVIDESLGYLVNRLARRMAGELSEALRPFGIGIGQWAVLLFLWERDGQSQAELARQVAIEPPTMVRTIDRMVRDGLVVREPEPGDRRATRISLTERGVALRDELVPLAVAVNEATLARLAGRQRAFFRRLLRDLLAA